MRDVRPSLHRPRRRGFPTSTWKLIWILAELGARALPAFEPQMGVIGTWDPDLFFLVEWPDWQTFLSLQSHPGYQEIAHLREEALEKSLLIRCRRSQLLG